MPDTWLDREPFTPQQLQLLDLGARSSFNKPWTELKKDFERVGKSPSADFVLALLVCGVLELEARAKVSA